eukprot:scaffold48694_cov56-Cyclotella_meneghiniana.AAC.4
MAVITHGGSCDGMRARQATVVRGSLLETAGAVNRHAKNPLVAWESWSQEREKVGVAGFSLLTPGGQKRTRLLPFLRVKSSDFDNADHCGRRHCPGMSD